MAQGHASPRAEPVPDTARPRPLAPRVRVASRADLPALRDLVERSFDHKTRSGFKKNWDLIAGALSEPRDSLLLYVEAPPDTSEPGVVLAYALLTQAKTWHLDIFEVDVARRGRGIGSAFAQALLQHVARTTAADFLFLFCEPQESYGFWQKQRWEPCEGSHELSMRRQVPRPSPSFRRWRQQQPRARSVQVRLLFGTEAWVDPHCVQLPSEGVFLPWQQDRPAPQRVVTLEAVEVGHRVFLPEKIAELQRQSGGYTRLLCQVDNQAVFFGSVMDSRDQLSPRAAELGLRPVDGFCFWLWGLRLRPPRRPHRSVLQHVAADPPPGRRRCDLGLDSDGGCERRYFQHLDVTWLAREYDLFDRQQRVSGPLDYKSSLNGDPRELAKEFLGVLEGFEFVEAEESDSEQEEPSVDEPGGTRDRGRERSD